MTDVTNEKHCTCGKTRYEGLDSHGIKHRFDGPCYLYDADLADAAEARGEQEFLSDLKETGVAVQRPVDPSSPAEIFGPDHKQMMGGGEGVYITNNWIIDGNQFAPVKDDADHVFVTCNADDLSPQARRVFKIVGDVLTHFVKKNRSYGARSSYDLGAKGQFSDIYRKVLKLKSTLWDGGPVYGESLEEVCGDLIGHAALTIDFLRGGPESE